VTFALDRHTIFLTLAGSQAHGTAREGSDVDLRGVCIAPLATRLSLSSPFEQYEGPLEGPLDAIVRPRLQTHVTAASGLAIKTEAVVFDVAKFLGLCSTANPNALEILFADEQDWVFETPAWRRLHAERRRFLTRRVQQTFSGYALAQLRKIKTHRGWLLHPPARKPTREDFGLPAAEATLSRDDQNRIEQSIADKLRSYGFDDVELPKATRVDLRDRLERFVRDTLACPPDEVEARLRAVATHALGIPADVVGALNAEKKYRAALKHWDAFQTWQRQRNPARAALERRHGYDTKHAMHLVRLMRMGVEALEHDDLRVRRPDAAELAAIRDGQLSFDELERLSGDLQTAMARAAATTSLPPDVDRAWVDALAFELMSSDLG
jgi:predicted nucleotidyltransferase